MLAIEIMEKWFFFLLIDKLIDILYWFHIWMKFFLRISNYIIQTINNDYLLSNHYNTFATFRITVI